MKPIKEHHATLPLLIHLLVHALLTRTRVPAASLRRCLARTACRFQSRLAESLLCASPSASASFPCVGGPSSITAAPLAACCAEQASVVGPLWFG